MAPCDNLPAENGSVDLVTVSEAIHWFIPLGIEKFYHEVDRVLKPGGCLAIYEYGHAQFVNHPQHEEMNRANFEVIFFFLSFFFFCICWQTIDIWLQQQSPARKGTPTLFLLYLVCASSCEQTKGYGSTRQCPSEEKGVWRTLLHRMTMSWGKRPTQIHRGSHTNIRDKS